MDNHSVPLVIYGPDGERKVIGEARVEPHETVLQITSAEMWDRITEGMTDHLAVGEVVPAPKEGSPTLSFISVIRRPFTVEAVEVTEDNFDEIADLTGTKQFKADGTPFIETNRKIVPNVFRIYKGFWLTRMADNLRAYSAKTFNEMFMVDA